MGQIQQSINQLLGSAALLGGVKKIQQNVELAAGGRKDIETETRERAELEQGLKWSEEQELKEKDQAIKDFMAPYREGIGKNPDFDHELTGDRIHPDPSEQIKMAFGPGIKPAQSLDVDKALEGDQIATLNTQKHIYKASDNFRRTRQRINRAKHGAKGGK